MKAEKPWHRPLAPSPVATKEKPWKREPRKGAFAAHAAALLANGYSPVPIIAGTKRPCDKEWDRLRHIALTPAQIDDEARQAPALELGVAGGYGGLVPVDIDTEDGDIIAAVCSVLPRPTVVKKGRKGYTAFYRMAGEVPGRKFKPSATTPPFVEVLGTGQSVLPPTIHPDTRTPYEWLTDATLFNTRIEDLPELAPDFMAQLEAVLAPWLPQRATAERPAATAPETISNDRLRTYALDVLRRRAGELASMGDESGRNNALHAAAARVGSWVHHGVLSRSEVASELYGAYEACGGLKQHGRKQFEATLANGLKVAQGDELRTPENDDVASFPVTPEIQASISAMIENATKKHRAENVIPLPSAAPAGDEFVFASDFKAEMPPALIRGLLPRNGLVIDGGQSGAGKTFAEVDMAVALASGEDWFGQPCRERVGVVYIAAEGQSSIQRRFIAACRHRELDIADLPIAIPNWSSINLRDPKKRIEIMQKLRAVDAMMRERFGVRLGAIILDTVSASCPMKDENSNAEVGIVCRELREIADAADAVLIAVHHFGKSEDSGLRGGSAWRANCDHSRIYLATRDGPGAPARDRRMAIEKNRLGPEGELVKFELKIVSFGKDIYGDDVTECAIGVEGRVERGPRVKLNTHQEAFLKAYRGAYGAYAHTEVNGIRPHHAGVPIDHVREAFMATEASGQERLSPQELSAKRQAWSRAFREAKKGVFSAEIVSGIEWTWPLNVV